MTTQALVNKKPVKKRVGIITFHSGPNYGGFLQALSLQTSVQRMNLEVEFINASNPSLRRMQSFKPWVFRRPATFLAYYRKHWVFRQAVARLPQTIRYSSTDAIPPLPHDIIIVGSDVVWNFADPAYGRDALYAGAFPFDFRGKLLAYAPSIGNMPVDFRPPPVIIQGLKSFTAVSARDDRTRDWLSAATGVQAQIVVDPTWLPNVDGLCESVDDVTDRDLLVYGQFSGHQASVIQRAAKRRNLRTVSTGFYNRWCNVNRLDLSPLQWVAAVRQSGCIVTGAFHGALFAIRERKQFALVGSTQNLLKSLYWLDQLGLRKNLCENVELLDATLDLTVDWEGVTSSMAALGHKSYSFLSDMLRD